MIYTNHQLQTLLLRALVAITGEPKIIAEQLEAHVSAIEADCAKVRAQGVEKAEARKFAQAESELASLRLQVAAKDARITALEAEVKGTAAKASLLAVGIIAQACHKPANLPADDEPGSDLMARFEKEKDPERRAALYQQIMAATD